MPKKPAEESQKKHGDELESLIDRTGDEPNERGARGAEDDEELHFDRDSEDTGPKDDDEDDDDE
jgi:hypothetical protein